MSRPLKKRKSTAPRRRRTNLKVAVMTPLDTDILLDWIVRRGLEGVDEAAAAARVL